MTLSSNHLLTAGAVAFAGFALWFIAKRPGQTLAVQPAQQQRDGGLAAWNDLLQQQAAQFKGSISYSLANGAHSGIFGY